MKTPHQKRHLPSALHCLLPSEASGSGEHMRLQELALPKPAAQPVFFKKTECMGLHCSGIQSCFNQSAHSNQI